MAMTEGDIEEAGGDDYLLPKARRVRQLREELGTGRGTGGDRADGRPSSSVSEQAETAEGAAQTPEAFGGPPPCLPPPPLESYTSNSAREEECLERLRGIFRDHLPTPTATKVTAALNEHGIPKPLPTFVRPTLQPHPSLYDLGDTVQFVHRFLASEPLATIRPTGSGGEGGEELPTIASPDQAMRWRAGDALDRSTLLASLLLGAGYEAWVVSGTAEGWVARGETAGLEVPIDWRGDCYGEEDAGCDGDREIPVESPPCDGGGPAQAQDPQAHAWVLVAPGRRSLPEKHLLCSQVFADPSVGRIWPTEGDDSKRPYLSIDAVWNHCSHYIRLIPKNSISFSSSATMPTLNFDDHDKWMSVYGEDDPPPPSWLQPVRISHDDVNLRYPPRGIRYEPYHRSTLSLISAPVDISRSTSWSDTCRVLTRYADNDWTEEIERIEWYGAGSLTREQGRGIDGLVERIHRPDEGFLMEKFSPSHPLGLSSCSEFEGDESTVEFYPHTRRDGLVRRRHVYGETIEEEFMLDQPQGLKKRVMTVSALSKKEAELRPSKPVLLPNANDGTLEEVTEIIEWYGEQEEVMDWLEEDASFVARRAVSINSSGCRKEKATLLYNTGLTILERSVNTEEDMEKWNHAENSIQAIHKDIEDLRHLRDRNEKRRQRLE